MKNIVMKARVRVKQICTEAKRVLTNNEGDQITGWLIVILLVVVVGAFFLNTYQSAIVDIWQGIVDKMKSTFGI